MTKWMDQVEEGIEKDFIEDICCCFSGFKIVEYSEQYDCYWDISTESGLKKKISICDDILITNTALLLSCLPKEMIYPIANCFVNLGHCILKLPQQPILKHTFVY